MESSANQKQECSQNFKSGMVTHEAEAEVWQVQSQPGQLIKTLSPNTVLKRTGKGSLVEHLPGTHET